MTAERAHVILVGVESRLAEWREYVATNWPEHVGGQPRPAGYDEYLFDLLQGLYRANRELLEEVQTLKKEAGR